MAHIDLTDPYDRLLLVLAIRDEVAAAFAGEPGWERSEDDIAFGVGDLAQIRLGTEKQMAADGTQFDYPLAVLCQWGAAYAFKYLQPYQVVPDAIRAASERFMARLSLGYPAHGLTHGNARALLAFDGIQIPLKLDGGCDIDVLNRLRAHLAADGRPPLEILKGRQPTLMFSSDGAGPPAPDAAAEDPLVQLLRLHSLALAIAKRERDGPVAQPAPTPEIDRGFWLGGPPPASPEDPVWDNDAGWSPPSIAERRAEHFWRDVSSTAALSRLATVSLASTPEGHAEACLPLLERVEASLPAPERGVLAAALAPVARMQHAALENLSPRIGDQRRSASHETGRWLRVLTAVEEDIHGMLGGDASTSRLARLQEMSAVHTLAGRHRDAPSRSAGLS